MTPERRAEILADIARRYPVGKPWVVGEEQIERLKGRVETSRK